MPTGSSSPSLSRGASLTALLVVISAVAALAHAGVTNPAVMARMESMKASGDSLETLGRMVKGESPFDPETARQSLATISEHAANTIALFAAPEADPKSEARPEIWQDFADFSAKADDLENLAQSFVKDVGTKAELTQAVGAISKACRSCHKIYKD